MRQFKNAKEFYDSLESKIDFTELTSTGIKTNYNRLFEFADEYLKAQTKAIKSIDIEKQVKKVITDTCTHWICADENEVEECCKEIREQFEAIVNEEIDRKETLMTEDKK